MRLSPLQRYILGVCWGAKKKVSRAVFDKYQMNGKRKHKDAVDAVTKTLERLIDKGLLIGCGVRTPKKWYIKEVRLSPLGRRTVGGMQKNRQGRLFR